MPALGRHRARFLVSGAVILAQLLQLLQRFEISAPRRCLTKVLMTLKTTLPVLALQCASTSERRSMLFSKLFNFNSGRRYRFAHRKAHRSDPCELSGIVKVLKMCSTTRRLGRPRKASLASASCSSSSRLRLRASCSTAGAESDIVCVSCARSCESWFVESSEKSVSFETAVAKPKARRSRSHLLAPVHTLGHKP